MKLSSIAVKNWPRKVASILCAFLIWYSVRTQLTEEETFRDIPVTLKHSEYLTLSEQDLPKLAIKLTGSKKRLKTLTNADIKVTGKISNEATPGRYTVLIRDKNVEIPGKLKIVDIQPDSFHVYVDKIETIEDIPIRCRFVGSLPEGYGRKSISVIPNTAQITGPSKVVRGLGEMVTDEIELRNIYEGFEKELVELVNLPQGVTVNPARVKVSVELYRMNDTKLFSDLQISVMNRTNTDFYVEEFIKPSIPAIEAVIEGPKATVDILTVSSLRPFIDISEIAVAGSYRLPVHFWVDAKDCSALEVKPMILEVRVTVRPK